MRDTHTGDDSRIPEDDRCVREVIEQPHSVAEQHGGEVDHGPISAAKPLRWSALGGETRNVIPDVPLAVGTSTLPEKYRSKTSSTDVPHAGSVRRARDVIGRWRASVLSP
jgi:hypothetical protein